MPAYIHIYVPSGVCALDLRLAVFAAGGCLGAVYECFPVQVEAGGRQAELVLAQSIILEALLGHGREPPSMDILGLDGGDVSLIAGDGARLWLGRILHDFGSTLLWKCA